MRIFHKHFDTSLTAALRKEHYVTFALINIIRVLLWERSLFVCNLQHKHFTKSFTYSMVHLQNCQNFTLWEHSCKLQNFKLKLQIKWSELVYNITQCDSIFESVQQHWMYQMNRMFLQSHSLNTPIPTPTAHQRPQLHTHIKLHAHTNTHTQTHTVYTCLFADTFPVRDQWHSSYLNHTDSHTTHKCMNIHTLTQHTHACKYTHSDLQR